MKPYFSAASITLFLSAVFSTHPASAVEGTTLTLKACSAMAAEINKNVPMAIDGFTTLETTFCTAGKDKPTMNYRAVMGAPKDKLNDIENGLLKMRSQQLNSWCTDPEQVKVIRVADIKNIYYDINRVYVGEIGMRFADCKLVK
jgi:hypothetical protein